MANNKTHKPYKIKPTYKHRKLVNEVIETNGNITQAMKNVGYSSATANTPKAVTGSTGFIIAMEEAGLTDDFLNNHLHDEIRDTTQSKVPALSLAFKLKGKLVEKQEIKAINVEILGEEKEKIDNVIKQYLN